MTKASPAPALPSSLSPAAVAVPAIAITIALLHLLTNSRYGFHRDELQFLSDARHMDWGFVAYPPLTPCLEHISLSIFGLSLVGLRLFSVLAQSTAILFTGLMARDLGGSRLAQATAALSIALSPLPLFEGTEFQYSSFDYLWWTLIAFSLIRLFTTGNPRWWLAIGAAIGLGLETKYTIVFLIAGLLGSLALTRARRWFLSPWFWAGVAIALLLFLPNLLWQVRHDFISYHFLQHIHDRDTRMGRASSFLPDQFRICVNVIAAPLWVAGLVSFLRGKRHPGLRPMAFLYLIPFALFALGKGRGYYLAAAYPPLIAMGAVAATEWLRRLRPTAQRVACALFFPSLVLCGLYILAIIIPLVGQGPLRQFALQHNGDLREEIGWDQMLQSIAQVRDSLTAQQQANLGIVVGNYGENGAIELLGPAWHLPAPISGTNSAWLHGYPPSQPTTNIVLGVSDKDREAEFTACHLTARIPYPAGQDNEESRDHAEIYLCGPPRKPWPQLWKEALSFG